MHAYPHKHTHTHQVHTGWWKGRECQRVHGEHRWWEGTLKGKEKHKRTQRECTDIKCHKWTKRDNASLSVCLPWATLPYYTYYTGKICTVFQFQASECHYTYILMYSIYICPVRIISRLTHYCPIHDSCLGSRSLRRSSWEATEGPHKVASFTYT